MKKILLKPQNLSLIIAIIVSLIVFVFTEFIPAGKRLELSAYDVRLNLFGRINKIDERIVVIGINPETIKKLGIPPYPRNTWAKLIENLNRFNPKAISFDIIFDTPDKYSPKNDEDFTRAINKSKVILGNNFTLEGPSYAPVKQMVYINPIEPLLKNCWSPGYVKVDPDTDGIIRTIKLTTFDGKNWVPQLDLATIALMEGVKSEDIKVEKDRIIIGKRIIPTNENNEIYINYQTDNIFTSSSTFIKFTPISLSKALEKDFSAYENSVFLIGSYFDEGGDFHKTPFRQEFGIKIHANILNTILNESYIYRVSGWVNLLITLVIAIILGLLLHRINAKLGFLLSLGIIIIFITINFYLFYEKIWIAFYCPLLSIFLCFALIEIYQFLRTYKLFKQFLPSEYVDDMLKDVDKQKLGGQEVEATVLFSDIRGYTNLSEDMSPVEVMEMLNQYHTKMGAIFDANQGRVFDYQGDAQMVVFGVKKGENHALNAVKCALGMQNAIAELISEWKVDEKKTFDVGIGLCTGSVSLGFVGSDAHKQLAAIGDTTNTAARLQGLSKQLDSPITISHKTYEYVKDFQDDFTCEELEPVPVKGKKEPVRVYRVKRKSKE